MVRLKDWRHKRLNTKIRHTDNSMTDICNYF